MDQLPLSPPSEPVSRSSPDTTAPTIPLDTPLRAIPIHPLLPDIRVPDSLPPHQYNPITCAALETDNEHMRAELEQLRKEFPTPDAALKAQEQAARELKQKLEDAEKKREEVQRAMDKKIKERNTELKVLEKFQDGKGAALAAA
ncbi:uncharacterized protein DSM5745_00916 [Aspergillus mulundensis]|uniref:Uncharacterized protein n=1 Tax=Aspergillus mulundensis TaxID=1810919 RepID=A0A3D8T4Z7_9EURO|nr:Uncharacterized protein DSM5745_00916 [Aspergillus mulundensis]RDW93594.1 Uncharacterized protein DSM5745_00916 [Aspergillus mulundensis]